MLRDSCDPINSGQKQERPCYIALCTLTVIDLQDIPTRGGE